MQRPSSRGGQGGGVPPQGSAMRGTASRNTQGTVRRPVGPDGQPTQVGLSTQVAVADRPVTQQGMMGVRTATQGPGRQVQDKSYFVGQLRGKMQEIQKEITKLRDEHAQKTKDNNAFQALLRRNEIESKKVRSLQGDLADLNLLVDKLRTDVSVEVLAKENRHLKSQNDTQRRQVDRIFTEKKTKENGVSDVEKQIADLYADAERQLNELPEEKRHLYVELQRENQQYVGETATLNATLNDVNGKIRQLDEELKHDPLKQKAISLAEEKKGLVKEKEELSKSTTMNMSVAEEKEHLLAKVKEDNHEIALMEKQLTELRDTLKSLKDHVRQVDTDLQEHTGEKSAKYRELLERDREMQEFIDTFGEQRNREQANIIEAQNTIVSQLKSITMGLARQNSMPSAKAAKDMKGDLKNKHMQMEFSKSTAQKLQDELTQRQSELARMATLDTKIEAEKTALNTEMSTMREKLTEYSDLDGLQDRLEKEEKGLAVLNDELKVYVETMKTVVYGLNKEVESERRSLASNEMASTLENLEQKIRTYEQGLFVMHEFIENKGREADYEKYKKDVKTLVSELNQLVIQVQMTRFV